ncbi:MAG: rod shape-determining protein MreD [Candidatus Omnitrophota bacterium]
MKKRNNLAVRKIFIIAAISIVFFVAESILFYFFRSWVKPNLLILLVIFFNMHQGIRYALVAAVCAGVLKDSFSGSLFGLYLFSFVACAYLMVALKKYLFGMEFKFSTTLMTSVMIIVNAVMVFLLQSSYYTVDAREALIYIVLPEVIITLLIFSFIFEKLKKCALKFSV